MADRKLRAVGADEKPAVPERESLESAVLSRDPLRIAVASRWDIVDKLKDASGAPAAALHRQLALANDKIDSLLARAAQEDDPVAKVEDGDFDEAAI